MIALDTVYKEGTAVGILSLPNPNSTLFLDCEECLGLFQNRSTSGDITGPSFILDFPTSMGIPQRALLTLPYGLVIGRSSIPNAGIGVLNNGPVVSPGMHFGPYEGEVTAKENALTSPFSWEVSLDIKSMSYYLPNMNKVIVLNVHFIFQIILLSADLQRRGHV